MNAALATAISATTEPVRQGAASIESAFLAAGDGLGQGLESFEALEGRLSALTVELSEEAMADAMRSLGEVAAELVHISDRLPVDGATLAELVECNGSVEARLQGLMEKMRMMFTLARAARIEAASVDQSSVDFVHFTLEIMALTRSVQDDIGVSARGQVKLAGLLQAALQAQSAFEHHHRQRLLDLAGELTGAVAILTQRQAAGAGVMQQLSVRSRRIGDAVRTAIMALQMGDTTRQRLEHVDEGLRIALDHAGTEQGADLVPCLGGLLAFLLADAARDFASDAGQIDGAFAALLEDAGQLVDLGRDCEGQGGAGSASALDAVGDRVTRAMAHIGECETARSGVDDTIRRLREQLADVDGAVTKVSTVIADIVLIGVNAGLRAGRLGEAGRSLVVIAQELKSLATGIAEDAKVLLVLLSKLGTVAARLDRGKEAEVGSAAHAMAGVLEGLRAGADRVAGVLRDIERTGGTFRTDLTGVRARFADAAAFTDELSGIAVELDAAAAADAPADPSAIRGIIDAAMRPRYTMARERQVHEEALGWLGPADAQAPPPSVFDDLLVA